jgi:hypothetical protein
VEPDSGPASQDSLEGVEQPRQSLGGTEFADVEQSRLGFGFTAPAVKEILAIAGANHMDAGGIQIEIVAKPLRITGVKDDEGIVAGATGTDVVG